MEKPKSGRLLLRPQQHNAAASVAYFYTALYRFQGTGPAPQDAFLCGYDAIRIPDFEGSTVWIIENPDKLEIVATRQLDVVARPRHAPDFSL